MSAPEEVGGRRVEAGGDGPDGRVDLRLVVDGRPHQVRVDPRSLLLEALRDDVGVTAPKQGCLTGDCGACTVRVDGDLAKSCLRLAVSADGAGVATIAGMASAGPGGEVLTPLQTAFWDRGAFQCGFCLSGMLLAAQDLLERVPDPSAAEVRAAISGNLCRCTGYDSIVAAVLDCARPERARAEPARGATEHPDPSGPPDHRPAPPPDHPL